MEKERDERLISILDKFLKEGNEESGNVSGDLLNNPADYVEAYVKNMPDIPETPSQAVIRSRTESLLDSFISFSSKGAVLTDALKNSVSHECEDDLSDASGQKDVDGSFYTQTLARIYLKQHRYDKALEIIRSLYLNFPNKSIYFADQIRYLEKLVRINQKSE